MSRNKEHRGAAFGGRPIGSVFFVSAHLSFYIMNIYGYSLYIPCIFHVNLPSIFHIVSLRCFLIYGVKSRSGHELMTSFGPETCEIEPKLWLRTCPDPPRPVQEDKSLSAKQAFLFFLFKNYTFPIFITRLIIFH